MTSSQTSPTASSSIIRVGGRSNSGLVAGCLAHTLREHNEAQLRAIGPNAVYVATKAIIMARNFLADEGRTLVVVPAMEDGEIDGDTRTVVVLGVRWGDA